MDSNQTFPHLCRVLEIYEADFGIHMMLRLVKFGQ